MPEATRARGDNQQGEDNRSFFEKYGGTIFQMVAMWMISRFLFGGQQQAVKQAQPDVPAPSSSSFEQQRAVTTDYFPILPNGVFYNPTPPHHRVQDLPETFVPLWAADLHMDLTVYASEDPYFTDYNAKPIWNAEKITYGDYDDTREQMVELPATKSIQNNGTVYAHIFLRYHDAPIDPNHPDYVQNRVVYYRHTLTKFYPKKSIVKQKNLLKGGSEEEEEDIIQDQVHYDEAEQQSGMGGLLGNWTRRAPVVAYWYPNVTISVLSDAKTVATKRSIHPQMWKYFQLDADNVLDRTGEFGFFRPTIFPNDFWSLREYAYPVNETVSTLPLIIHFAPISMMKFQIYSVLEDAMEKQTSGPMGASSASEFDEIKRMFLETNPILLGTTIVVSIFHSLFEFLAFKSDISFWRQKQDSAGVSVRTLLVNIFFQIIIFLYLMDNNQETSWMILIGQGFGLLIEIWKVFKALKYEVYRVPGSIIPRIRLQENAQELTETESETKKYDEMAYRYLSWIAYPLLFGYAIYSLYYDEHKSWYSYVLKTLVGFVYMFGFITMTPQLFINYKLKSIAHMPWKTLMYKSLNTFIDDLFAFCIKMPTLHRLACLRDDVVFFVYLYQRWAYKVDHSRANEYGQVGVDPEEAEKTKKEDTKETKKTQ
ncbi:cleft lip and palate transmembrane protein 1-domain-containing protein [Umbelopsis sp. PMI_123]|nr:cleft lip and palate transmembrane protein 1-domain-containing protein [Umbelopsis sp. PMI_123]